MTRRACLLFTLPFLLLPAAAHAQAAYTDDRGAYASFSWGNGRINGPDAIGNHWMRWRSLELRIGRDLLVSDDMRTALRLDVVHYNEGHPDNNHRDGFAGQLVLSHKLNPTLAAELGVGPYSSMNTTVLDGVQYDQARRGTLASAALKITLPGMWTGTHLRVGFNHVRMADPFDSNSVQIGIGRQFPDPPTASDPPTSGDKLWLGVAYGRAITNMSGRSGSNGGALELKKHFGAMAGSLKLVQEGDDGVQVDRRGVAAQAWLVQPLTTAFAASFGAGPYWAQNRHDGNRNRLHGMFTLHFDYNADEDNKVFFAFSRVKTFAQMNDRDLFHVGVQHAFGG
jgi:hypothetical protein